MPAMPKHTTPRRAGRYPAAVYLEAGGQLVRVRLPHRHLPPPPRFVRNSQRKPYAEFWLSLSIPRALGERIRAAHPGIPVSRWVADTIERALDAEENAQ